MWQIYKEREGADMVITVLCCEDSLEGILTAVYEAYEKKLHPDRTRLQLESCMEIQLFSIYETVKSDREKTQKVIRTIRREFGEEVYYRICQVLASHTEDKADVAYHTIACGLRMKNKAQLFSNLSDPFICRAFEISRNVNNETHRHIEFLRFKELENKILFAKIGPKNNILTFLTPHFADRLPGENFVIYDETHQLVSIHPKGKAVVIAGADGLDRSVYEKYSEKEKEYQALFRYFCEKISIKERENKELQRQMLPLRFRDYMVEF